jgi:hypothetical protein
VKRISRYPVPDIADLPEDLRARMLEVQQKAGFVLNVFLTLAHRPERPGSTHRRLSGLRGADVHEVRWAAKRGRSRLTETNV